MAPAPSLRAGGRALLGAALLVLVGCGTAPSPPLRVVDVPALVAHVQPNEAHPAVLVNLWASW